MELVVFEKKWNIQILVYLHGKDPKRFKELLKICPRDATLTSRLKELEKKDLIETVPIKGDGEKYFAYRLKPNGEKAASLLLQISKI